jgi:hypothetical protein
MTDSRRLPFSRRRASGLAEKMHAHEIALSPDAGNGGYQILRHQQQLEFGRQFRGCRQFQLCAGRAHIANQAVDDRSVFIEDNLSVFESPLPLVSSAIGVLGHLSIGPGRGMLQINNVNPIYTESCKGAESDL